MKYKHVLQAIKSMHWCMTPEAYRGMLSLLEGELTEADYHLFHHAEKFELENLITNAGERVEALDYTFKNGNVGTILMDGPIVPRTHNFSRVSGILSVNGLVRDFEALEKSPDIEHIVLLQDTPGGATTGTSEFASRVRNSTKNVITFVYGTSASAGYWIGSAANKVYAVDTAILGSIGTIATLSNPDGDDIVITSDQSPLKNVDPSTEKGQAEYKQLVNSLTDIFAGAVAQNRGVTIEKVFSDFGKGGVMVASKALEAGMIDGIMTYNELINRLKEPKQQTFLTPAANAGKGLSSMNEFEKFLAENPAAKAQYDAQLQAQYDAGFKARSDKLAEVSAVAGPVLAEGSEYHKKIQSIAVRAMAGDATLEALETAMMLQEMLVEGKAVEQAKAESNEAGETPSPKPEIKPSEEVDSIEAADKYAAEIKASRGREVVVM